MPFDIEAVRQRVPDSFVEADANDERPDFLNIPERQPVRIWDPQDALGQTRLMRSRGRSTAMNRSTTAWIARLGAC